MQEGASPRLGPRGCGWSASAWNALAAGLGARSGEGQPPLACQLLPASGEGSLPVASGSQHRGALKVCCQRASLERKPGTPPWRPRLAPFLVDSQAHTPTCPNWGGGEKAKGLRSAAAPPESSRDQEGPSVCRCMSACVCACLQLRGMVYLFIEHMAGNIRRAGVRLCRKNTQQYDTHRREICGQFYKV